MARIPPIKRLTTEDFKDQTSWIGKLIQPLNEFMSSVSLALTRGLTFSENMAAQVKDVKVTHAASAYPLKFLYDLSSKPQGALVVRVVEVSDTPSVLSNAVYADWDYRDGQVIINNFTGLTNGNTYNVRVIILAG